MHPERNGSDLREGLAEYTGWGGKRGRVKLVSPRAPSSGRVDLISKGFLVNFFPFRRSRFWFHSSFLPNHSRSSLLLFNDGEMFKGKAKAGGFWCAPSRLSCKIRRTRARVRHQVPQRVSPAAALVRAGRLFGLEWEGGRKKGRRKRGCGRFAPCYSNTV